MGNELIVSQPSALTPADPRGLMELAQMICNSGLVPEALRGKPNDVAIILLKGKELGLGPMQSLGDLYTVHGQVGMQAKLMAARLLKAGHRYTIDVSTNERAVVTVTRRDGASFTQEITIDFATQQGWASRNKKYQESPALMLRYRALTWAVRAIAPDSLFGLQTADEIEDLANGGGDIAEAGQVAGEVVEGAVREVPVVNELRDIEEPAGIGQPWMSEGTDYDKWTLKPAERELFARFREEYGLSDVDAKRLAGQALDREPLAYFRDFPGDRLRLQAAILYELDAEVEDAAEKLEATEGEPE
jgi:hypothetical protein